MVDIGKQKTDGKVSSLVKKYLFLAFIPLNLAICVMLENYYPLTGGYIVTGVRDIIEIVLNIYLLLLTVLIVYQHIKSIWGVCLLSILLHIVSFLLSAFVFSIKGVSFENVYIMRYFFLFLITISLFYGVVSFSRWRSEKV